MSDEAVLEQNTKMVTERERERTTSAKRDVAIDIIRIFSIFLIILAHVTSAPEWLQNIRRFDVPVMVFISGIVFSYSKPIQNKRDYFVYLWKRVKKLIFTAWIFITIYILYMLILKISGQQVVLTMGIVARSYTLLDGIGYVWILRVLFCMAILAPLIRTGLDKIKSEYFTIGIFVVLLAVNTLIVFLNSRFDVKYLSYLLTTVFIPIIGYSCIYILGMRIRKFNLVQTIMILFTLACTLTGSILWLGFDLQSQKYPPNLGYISYGLIIGTILYVGLSKLYLKELKTITWLSNNSFLIYFIHTFFILTINTFEINWHWSLLYIFVLLASIAVAFVISAAKSLVMAKAKKLKKD